MAKSNRDVTAAGRLSYPNLFVPRAANDQAAPKYSATLLIPKSDTATIQRVQAAIDAAVQDGVDRHVFKQPIDPSRSKYPPLRDGDLPNDSGEPRGPEFAGHWFIAAKAGTQRKPFIVDPQLQPIIDENDIYAGCYVNMAVQFYAYENSGNKGISAALVGIQFAKDGERLGGPALEAEDVFGVIGGGDVAGGLGF
ncbi:DUF2815 family protein [Corynebacterium sp. MSK041]|uniref:DUF2815 family protein n=1 Tax=Corynebacterium sp. MSK041 TaxID=3050194 RepID=UPI00254DBBE9|nr:DUF2815 family protein [Corynebacterium sp. MSK041]MDK8794212.1 DUF2815 family protein [Corynebacterium sp. MSK041]